MSQVAAPTTTVNTNDRRLRGVSAAACASLIAIAVTVVVVVGVAAIAGVLGSDAADREFLRELGPLLVATFAVGLLAMVLAAPLAVGIALFLSHFAPRDLVRPLGALIDLMAAVPSVALGLWGVLVLAPALESPFAGLAGQADSVPVLEPFHVDGLRLIVTAAIVLALMIAPTTSIMCRELFSRTPRSIEDAAWALGATRWEVARLAVLPWARPGIIAATAVGLARAIGETIAVAVVLTSTGLVDGGLVSQDGPRTISTDIALRLPAADGSTIGVLLVGAFVLLIVTISVNLAARSIIQRPRPMTGLAP